VTSDLRQNAHTTRRPVRPDDADEVLRMWHAHHLAVLGRPDATADDVRDSLTDPDLDPASPVVLDGSGRVLGCGLVFHEGDTDHVELDVVVDPGPGADVQAELLGTALGLAAEGARRRGHGQVQVDQGCYRVDTVTADHLREAGFAPATAYYRMRRELDVPFEVRVPDGIRVERVDDDTDDVLRRAHRLHQSAFVDHFGFVARPYDEWLASLRARTGTGPLWFATLDGTEVGFLHETDQFVEDEDAGYVWRLGVTEEARGRGVAQALLTTAFAGMCERGRSAVLLHVDSANRTGATRLYESVGMRPAVVIDVWRRVLPLR
jgi:mycothiol synthase